MEIVPAIDIRGGRCVRLYQGDFHQETVFGDDPVAVARSWQEAGAARLHVVDLDGAREGRPANAQVVRRLIEALSIPVQVGGGLRDRQSIERYLEQGADRVVLGTAAVKDRSLLAQAIAEQWGAHRRGGRRQGRHGSHRGLAGGDAPECDSDGLWAQKPPPTSRLRQP